MGQQIQPPREYELVLSTVRHLDNRAWVTFGNFLTANSIILLAWATFFKEGPADRATESAVIMIALAIVGYLSGLGWALLCVRNLEYAYEFATEGRAIERAAADAPNTWKHGLVEDRVQERWTDKWKLSHQPVIVSGVPLAFSLLYVLLFAVALWQYGSIAQVSTLIIALGGAIPVRAVWVQCSDAYDGAKAHRKERELSRD